MGEMAQDAHDAMEHQMELGGVDEWGYEDLAADPLPGQVGHDLDDGSFARWLNDDGSRDGLGPVASRMRRNGRLIIV